MLQPPSPDRGLGLDWIWEPLYPPTLIHPGDESRCGAIPRNCLSLCWPCPPPRPSYTSDGSTKVPRCFGESEFIQHFDSFSAFRSTYIPCECVRKRLASGRVECNPGRPESPSTVCRLPGSRHHNNPEMFDGKARLGQAKTRARGTTRTHLCFFKSRLDYA